MNEAPTLFWYVLLLDGSCTDYGHLVVTATMKRYQNNVDFFPWGFTIQKKNQPTNTEEIHLAVSQLGVCWMVAR